MTPERWKQIRELFDAALEQPPRERLGFLARSAAGDAALIEEVNGLLAAEEETGGVLDDGPVPTPLIDMYEGRLSRTDRGSQRPYR